MRRPLLRTPVSSYRIQLQASFPFRAAAAIVPYLAALGVTECYASPYLRARPGSRHGYDICDYTSLNPELGDADDYRAFADALRSARLGHIFDLVPNHMSVDPSSNLWWRDVLTYGRSSRFAHFFDIDWTPIKTELAGKVLLPILACQYGQALENGDLTFSFVDDAPVVCYGSIRLPIDPATLEPFDGDRETITRTLNGTRGDAASFDALHALLEHQHYRLAYWRTSSHEINYRRFFDIDELVGVRMEDPEVFAAAHHLLARLIADGTVTGLRIDHLDGLAAPSEYCDRLQQLSSPPLYVVVEKIQASDQTLPEQWALEGTTGYQFLNTLNGLFIQPAFWRPLQRAYTRFTGRPAVFADVAYLSKKLVMETTLSSELNALAQMLNRISEHDRRFRDFTLNSLRRTLREFIACLAVYRTYLSPSFLDLADELRIREAMAQARFRNPELESTIFEFVLNVLLGRIDADDPGRHRFVRRLQQYTGSVQARGVEDTAFYRHNVLLSVNEVGGDPARPIVSVDDFHRANQRRQDVWPLEMTTTATHDTKLGEDVRARVNALSDYADRWPAVVRRWARLNAPNRTRVAGAWAPDRNDEYRFYQVLVGTWPAPHASRADAATVAASLVERLDAYMQKAIKEAKLHTSWINDYEEYDQAVSRFVQRTLSGPSAAAFLDSFVPFAADVATAGCVNSLSQLVLKIASPGVPDFYQGTELWDLHLVDPDNRQPVDFDKRSRELDALVPLIETAAGRSADLADAVAARVRHLVDEWTDGRIKLFVTAAGLRLRQQFTDAFLGGRYSPVDLVGEAEVDLVSFSKDTDDVSVIVVAPRFAGRFIAQQRRLPLADAAWGSAQLVPRARWPAGAVLNVFTGERIAIDTDGDRQALSVARVLAHCPVALLVCRR